MSMRSNGTGVGIVMLILVVLILCLNFTIGAVLWPYTINTWLVYSGKAPAIEWWMGGLGSFVPGIGQLAIPGAIATWIAQMFLNEPEAVEPCEQALETHGKRAGASYAKWWCQKHVGGSRRSFPVYF